MNFQGPCERGDGRQESLLQTDKGEFRHRRLLSRKIGDAPHAHLAIGGKLAREFKLRRIFRQARDANRLDDPLRERLAKTPKIGLKPPNHDRFEILGPNLDASREALGIEHLEQSREAVGMAVVRRRGQEQPVLEPLPKFANRLRELA